MPYHRSEDMIRCQVLLHQQSVFHWTREILNKHICHFIDTKPSRNQNIRPYSNELKKVMDIERQLEYFETNMVKANIKPNKMDAIDINVEYKEIDDMNEKFSAIEDSLVKINLKIEELEKVMKQLKELSYVLEYADQFFQHRDAHLHIAQQHTLAESGLIYASGILPLSKILGFNRLVYLLSKGNIFIRYFNIPDPVLEPTAEHVLVYKSVFLVICHGDKMLDKLRKISTGYRASIYEIPEQYVEREKMLTGVEARLKELTAVLAASYENRRLALLHASENFVMWKWKACKLQMIVGTISMYIIEGITFTSEFFMPVMDISMYLQQYQIVWNLSGVDADVVAITIPIKSEFLPTYIITNRLTHGFQAIIDAYGIANYKELNPALFALISFPFLFSLMFGDLGHGILLFLFGLFLALREKKLFKYTCNNEIFEIIFGGRYIILLMGLFSMYAGIIYNDNFSRPFNLYHSAWNVTSQNFKVEDKKAAILDPSDKWTYSGTPYPIGLDPTWGIATNKITFFNSYKKKISILFGVLQMTLGVFLKLSNDIYFRNTIGIIFEFIPMLIFLFLLFGYLCFLIVMKWTYFITTTIQAGNKDPDAPDFYQCSPNLLIGFINLFIMKKPKLNDHCSNQFWFPHQEIIQTVFILLALLSVMVLLLAKPLYLYFKNKKALKQVGPQEKTEHTGHSGMPNEMGDAGTALQMRQKVPKQLHEYYTDELRVFMVPYPEKERFQFGDVFVHQCIHTIEFCLGCVSHTASYLRLWALSLAHSELSEVLWNLVFKVGLLRNEYYGFALFVVFAPFAVLTIAILLVMEGLSAFLHTLRLHWVEFNSKFYSGNGIKFKPQSFKDCAIKLCKYNK